MPMPRYNQYQKVEYCLWPKRIWVYGFKYLTIESRSVINETVIWVEGNGFTVVTIAKAHH